MLAIAAMSKNRVIGNRGAIPWRIPDEFKWFRRKTLGSFLIMGRRTFESLPKPLDGRITIVLTRHPEKLRRDEETNGRFAEALTGAAAHRVADILPGHSEVRLARSLESLQRAGIAERAWLCGGVQLYEQFLSQCSELFLSVIDREVEGDAFFPPFEHLFDLAGVEAEFPEFRVLRYVRNENLDAREPPGQGITRAAPHDPT
jgi:dihydrofolate reductase